MIIGIDPGLRWPAMACVDKNGVLLWLNVLDGLERAPIHHPLWQRCGIIADWARGTIVVHNAAKFGEKIFQSPSAYIEDAAYNKRFQSESLASVRQAIHDRILPICRVVEPVGIQEAKRALTGNGHAKKADMQTMAFKLAGKKMFPNGYPTKPEREAAADAFGIALAGLAKFREMELATR